MVAAPAAVAAAAAGRQAGREAGSEAGKQTNATSAPPHPKVKVERIGAEQLALRLAVRERRVAHGDAAEERKEAHAGVVRRVRADARKQLMQLRLRTRREGAYS
jgi:hypothetical protein